MSPGVSFVGVGVARYWPCSPVGDWQAQQLLVGRRLGASGAERRAPGRLPGGQLLNKGARGTEVSLTRAADKKAQDHSHLGLNGK